MKGVDGAAHTLTEGQSPSSSSPSPPSRPGAPSLLSTARLSGSVPLRPCSPKTESCSEWDSALLADGVLWRGWGALPHYDHTMPPWSRICFLRPAGGCPGGQQNLLPSWVGLGGQGSCRGRSCHGHGQPLRLCLSASCLSGCFCLAAFRCGLSHCFHPPS